MAAVTLLQTIQALDAPYVVWLTAADLFTDLGFHASPYSAEALFAPEMVCGLRVFYYATPTRSPLHDLVGLRRIEPVPTPAEIDAMLAGVGT